MDIFTKAKRSRVMAAVRGRNTRSEVMLCRSLFQRGFYLLKNVNSLLGSPDIVLPEYDAIIFVNGCFWHAHENCEHFRLPESRRDFWKEKLWKNKVRDSKNRNLLEKEGWNVVTVWECSLKEDFERTFWEIVRQVLRGSSGHG